MELNRSCRTRRKLKLKPNRAAKYSKLSKEWHHSILPETSTLEFGADLQSAAVFQCTVDIQIDHRDSTVLSEVFLTQPVRPYLIQQIYFFLAFLSQTVPDLKRMARPVGSIYQSYGFACAFWLQIWP